MSLVIGDVIGDGSGENVFVVRDGVAHVEDEGPPFITFTWGSETTFKSVCTSLTVAYKLVRPNGDPIRADVKLTLKQAKVGSLLIGCAAGAFFAGVGIEAQMANENLTRDLGRGTGVQVTPGDFNLAELSDYLRMNIRVVDEAGWILAEWTLLTNVPAESADASQIAMWYYWRWRIESFFKLLKSHGHHLEQWQQESGPAIATSGRCTSVVV